MGALKELYRQFIDYPIAIGSLAGLVYGAFTFMPRMFSLEKTRNNIEEHITDMLIALALVPIGTMAGRFYNKHFYKSEYHKPLSLLSIFKKQKSLKPNSRKVKLRWTPVKDVIDYCASYADIFRSSSEQSLDKIIIKNDSVLKENPLDCAARMKLLEAYVKKDFMTKACVQSKELATLVQSGMSKPMARGFVAVKYLLDKKDLHQLFISANIDLIQGCYENAIYKFNKLAEKRDPQLDVAIATILSAIPSPNYSDYCQKRSNSLFKRAIIKLIPTLKPENRLCESGNHVYALDNEFLGSTIIFKAKKDRQSAELEAENASRLEQILRDKTRMSVPKPLPFPSYPLPIAGQYFHIYAMEREQGRTLLEELVGNRTPAQSEFLPVGVREFAHFLNAVALLATVHARADYSTDKSAIFRKLHLKKARHEKLGFSKLFRQKMLFCSEPLYNSLKSACYVQDCDAHPANFQKCSNDYVVLLDTERNQLIPQQIDLAKLICWLPNWAQDKLINHYIGSYVENSKPGAPPIQEEDFRLKYFNAVIYNAISLPLVWRAEDRKAALALETNLSRAASSSINKIQNEFGFYFDEYAQEYNGLRQIVSEIPSQSKSQAAITNLAPQ